MVVVQGVSFGRWEGKGVVIIRRNFRYHFFLIAKTTNGNTRFKSSTSHIEYKSYQSYDYCLIRGQGHVQICRAS
jgi:hypothetical protein